MVETATPFYEKIIKDRVKRIVKGEKPAVENVLCHAEFAEFARFGLIRPSPTEMLSILNVRGGALTGILYDRLRELKERGVNIGEVVARAKDPLLNNAVIWLEKNGGIGKVGKKEFVDGYDSREGIYSRKLPTYVRPLAFLEILIEHPESVSRVDATSTYFPRGILGLRSPLSTLELEAEAVEIIPSLFSEEMVALMTKLSKFIGPQLTRYSQGVSDLGKYRLPKERFTWKNLERTTEGVIDELFDETKLKREVYETLAEFSVVTGAVALKGKGSLKTIGRRSDLFLNATEYARAHSGIEEYARNQLFWLWEEKKVKKPETSLSRFSGLSAYTEDDRLNIKSLRTKGIEMRSHGPNYRNTISFLPYFTAILNRAYQEAVALPSVSPEPSKT